MRSEVSKKILSETSDERKQKVRESTNELLKNMKAKDKAEELIEKFKNEIGDNCEHSSYCNKKSCQTENGIFCFVDVQTVQNSALICVDEILKTLNNLHNRSVLSEYVELKELQEYVFYQQVKQEILNRQ